MVLHSELTSLFSSLLEHVFYRKNVGPSVKDALNRKQDSWRKLMKSSLMADRRDLNKPETTVLDEVATLVAVKRITTQQINLTNYRLK